MSIKYQSPVEVAALYRQSLCVFAFLSNSLYLQVLEVWLQRQASRKRVVLFNCLFSKSLWPFACFSNISYPTYKENIVRFCLVLSKKWSCVLDWKLSHLNNEECKIPAGQVRPENHLTVCRINFWSFRELFSHRALPRRKRVQEIRPNTIHSSPPYPTLSHTHTHKTQRQARRAYQLCFHKLPKRLHWL